MDYLPNEASFHQISFYLVVNGTTNQWAPTSESSFIIIFSTFSRERILLALQVSSLFAIPTFLVQAFNIFLFLSLLNCLPFLTSVPPISAHTFSKTKTWSLIQSCTHSLTHSFTHSLTCSLIYLIRFDENPLRAKHRSLYFSLNSSKGALTPFYYPCAYVHSMPPTHSHSLFPWQTATCSS